MNCGSSRCDRRHLRGLRGRLVHPRRDGGEPHRRVRPADRHRGRAALGRAAHPDRALGLGRGAAGRRRGAAARSSSAVRCAAWRRRSSTASRRRRRPAASTSRSTSTSAGRGCSGTTRTASPSPASTGSATRTTCRAASWSRSCSPPPRASTTTSRSSSMALPTPPVADLAQGLSAAAELAPGQETVLRVRYRSRGLGDWTYAFTSSGVAQVRDFQLADEDRFPRIDFPAGTLSPTARAPLGEGWNLTWRFASLVTGQRIGMDAPEPPQPRPARRAHHLLRAGVAAVLHHGDGHPGRDPRPEPAPDALLLRLRGVLRVPPAAGLPGGPRRHPRRLCHLRGDQPVPRRQLPARWSRAAASPSRRRARRSSCSSSSSATRSSSRDTPGSPSPSGAIVTLFVLMQLTARVRWEEVFAPRRRRRVRKA